MSKVTNHDQAMTCAYSIEAPKPMVKDAARILRYSQDRAHQDAYAMCAWRLEGGNGWQFTLAAVVCALGGVLAGMVP